MATKNERVIVDIIVKSQGATRALKNMDKSLQSVEKSSRRTANNMQFLRDVTGLATTAILLHNIAKAFLAVNIAQQRVEKGFTAVTGSAEKATQELAYTAEVAERLGLNFYDVSKAWIGVMAAAKGSTVTTQEARTVFEAFSGAMSKLGKSSEDVKGVLLAVQQIFSKGVISAEEWKNQIGERLPGAMALLANSLKKTTGEVMKMMEAGEITSKQLVRVAEDLEDLYDTGDRMEGLLQDWNRLGNAVDRVMVALGKAGVIDAITAGIGNLARNISVLSNMSEGLSLAQAQLVVQYDELEGAIPGMALLNAQLGNAYEELNAVLGESGSALQNTMAWLEKVGMGEEEHAKVVKEKRAVVEALEKAIKDLNKVTEERQRKLELVNDAEAESARMKEYQIQLTRELAEEERQFAKLDRERAALVRKDDADRGTVDREMRAVRQMLLDMDAVVENREAILKLTQEEYRVYKQSADLQRSMEKIREKDLGLDPSTPGHGDRVAAWEKMLGIMDEFAPKILSTIQKYDQVIERQKKMRAAAEEVGDAVGEAFGNFVMGSQSAKEALAGVLQSLSQMILQLTVIKPIAESVAGALAGKNGAGGLFSKFASTAVGGLFTNADGNAIHGGTGLPHGVYSSPTAFPINGGRGVSMFANGGIGILGEAGSEAIMPLSRGRDGKLGVSSEGSAPVVNVYNNSGSQVDVRQGAEPGEIDIVVQRLSDDVIRGGTTFSNSFEQTYGLQRRGFG